MFLRIGFLFYNGNCYFDVFYAIFIILNRAVTLAQLTPEPESKVSSVFSLRYLALDEISVFSLSKKWTCVHYLKVNL